VLFAAAVPLVRYSLSATHAPHASIPLLLGLLLANLLLLALCAFGMGAWGYALFQSLRATHAKVANDATAIRRKSTVSSSTTPAN